jgi:hypothetical protein
MFDGFSKREILVILGGLLVIAVLGVYGGVYLAKTLVGDRSNDPLDEPPPNGWTPVVGSKSQEVSDGKTSTTIVYGGL